MTDTLWLDAALRGLGPVETMYPTPGDLEKYLDPRTLQTPALDLIDAELVRVAEIPDSRVIMTMPPQEGKSTRVAGAFPVWWLLRRPNDRIAVASYASPLAIRNGRAIRRRVTMHPELGLQITPGNASVSDWTLQNHDGGVLSVGIRSGLTGRPAELLVIDDPIKDQKEADSETFRNAVWDWWQTVASARLAPGAPVVVILTRWHQDDLAGRLLAEESSEWRVLNIPAQAEHRPEKGESDVLGRKPGQFMLSARGRTTAQWERRKTTAGPRAWAALYQGHPSPEAGGILRAEWWRYYTEPLWIVRDDGSRVVLGNPDDDAELCQSWDMTFKDTRGSDYVVGQVWLRRGVNAYLLDQVRGRWTFAESCNQLLALSARWPQAILKLIEDKANGPAVMNALAARVGGMVPVEPEGSKYARASAVSPFVEGGNVWLPEPGLAPWVGEFIEEAKAFPNAANDDQVDGFTQAVHRLLLVPILSGGFTSDDMLDDDEMDDELEYAASGLSPY